MHKSILAPSQIKLLPLVKSFSGNFGLVGGTAIALQIGHRHSIDFDLFTDKPFDNGAIRRKLRSRRMIAKILKDERGQYTLIIDGVQFTFFQYIYPIKYKEKFADIIKIPDLLTLAAMKAFALGRRAKWKDYVDLYFIMKKYHGPKKIEEKAEQIFGNEFNKKIFRSQLSYFDDINYTEEVIYLPGQAVKDGVVKKGLIEFSLE